MRFNFEGYDETKVKEIYLEIENMAPVRESNGANVGNYFLWEMLQGKRERIGELYT